MKIIKTILIVIFALVFVVSAGLLGYGILFPPVEQEKDNSEIGAPPDMSLFEGATHRDVSLLVDDATLASEKKATDMMLQAAYNLINIKQYYFSTRVEVLSGSDLAFSDYTYTKNGLNTFKKVQAYTGTLNTFVLRCYYMDQKLESNGTSDYDFDKDVWSYSVLPPTPENKTHSKEDETPYYFASPLDFPLDFGGTESADDDSTLPRSEAINYDLIDPDSVEIVENEEEGYYTLTFTALASKLNASYETKYRLSKQTTSGRMKNIVFEDFTVKAEIWKESGVFRTLSYKTNVSASIGTDSGDSEIEKIMKFSYDDVNCSIAKKIMSVKDKDGATIYYNALNDTNKAKCDAEIQALSEKAKKTDDEE